MKRVVSMALGTIVPILLTLGWLWEAMPGRHSWSLNSAFFGIHIFTGTDFFGFIQLFALDGHFRALAFLAAFGVIMGLLSLIDKDGSARSRNRPYVILFLWLMTGSHFLLFPGKFFRYHYLPLLPPSRYSEDWFCIRCLPRLSGNLERLLGDRAFY